MSTGNNQSQSANQSKNVPENKNENTQNGNVTTTNISISNTIQQKNNNKKKRKRNRSLSPNPTGNNSSTISSPSLNSVNKKRGNDNNSNNNRNKKRRKTKSRQTFWVETTGKDCDNVLQQSKSGDGKKSASCVVGTQNINHSQDQSNLTIVITKSYIIDGFMNEGVDCNSDCKSVKNQYSIDSEFLRCLEEESHNRPETSNNKKNKIIVYRSPSTKKFVPFSSSSNYKNKKPKYIELPNGNNGDGIPNPDNGKIDDKYWAQRKRFFTKFDSGIQLDHEGWFSVTPEAIATHIREKTTFLWKMKMKKQEKLQSNSSCKETQDGIVDHVSGNDSREKNDEGLVVLDAFCGCGGNAIAYARDMQNVEESPSKSKIPKTGGNDQAKTISLVIAVDIDLNKLKMAAHNASIYNISSNKILFVHGDAIHVLKNLNLPRKKTNQSIITKEGGHSISTSSPLFHEGYKIINVSDLGAIDVDVVFLSPPWGGVKYKNFGGNDFGFDLKNHIQLRVPCNNNASSKNNYEKEDTVKDNSEDESGSDSEEDEENSESCQIIESSNSMSEQSTVLVDGDELLALASGSNIERETYTTNKENQEQIMNNGQNRMVVYFLPKNLNGFSLGSAALNAGYGSSTMYTGKGEENNKFRNNFIEIEQNMLNGKLKTVTGYLI